MPVRILLVFLCLMTVPMQTGWPQSQEKASSKNESPLPELHLSPIEGGLKIDGVLDEAVWKNSPLPVGEWITYNPLYGNKISQTTRVWATYDPSGLYFAFDCVDSEPDRIKTAISRRDTIFNDDWVGLSLDSLSSHQSSYEFMVNPSGIQADLLNSSTAGEDSSPDWVWQSAARRTADGYTVEIGIPFKTIRFKSGADVRMEVLFWRRVSRLGTSVSWPDLPPGVSIFSRHAPLILHNVKRPMTLELIPNITYALNQSRSAPDRWESDSDPDSGITAKYGISSTVTLDGTYRPDFSQVESDAFQLEVNQRYPIFYSEKRPFFMEGMGTFDLAGVGGDGNMRTAVHTRRIIDPLFGLKLTGTIGKVTFATLSSADRAPGNTDPDDPLYEKKQYFNIARGFYSLGKGTYIGGLITDTELGDGHNHVIAGDISLQFGEHQQLSATSIASGTRNSDGSNDRRGMAGQLSYSYSSKRQYFGTQVEHFDQDFQMDTAFYNRTGITANWTYYAYSFYPDEKRYSWFKKFTPFVWLHSARDRTQGGDETFFLGGVRMNFTKQGFFRVDYGGGQEAWAGELFHTNRIQWMGNAQFFHWLYVYGYARVGRSIYYDREHPFSGDSRSFTLEVTLQPSVKFNQSIVFNKAIFNRPSGGGCVYSVDIINLKTTYQFSNHFFVRAIERYDSSRKRVMLDFLASYEPIPGTVAYAGYGAAFDRSDWDGDRLVPGTQEYVNTQRSLFFKLSYLYRF
ncbi:MAG: DUF5916 domain-containing protein [Acidobacteriota bacterium]|nr:DUF5916 domain-containing protein [Acidobacteriota bacterium]